MRTGTAVSGAAHAALVAAMLIGVPWMSVQDPAPMSFTEVTFIDGADFDARLSTAPVVPNEGPAEMSPPVEDTDPALAVDAPDTDLARLDPPAPAEATTPPEAAPQNMAMLFPRPPVEVPTEAPRLSIAEIPTPDALDRQAREPESPPSTEPLQPLAAAPTPMEAPQPSPPPEPEPVVAETEPEPEPEEAEAEPEPEAVAEAQPDAPISNAPQEARLPVARPAEVAAAAQVSSAPKPQAEPEPEVAETPKPDPAPEPAPEPTVAEAPEAQPEKPQRSAGSSSEFAAIVTQGEKDALRLGIKQYFTYAGNRADRSLRVTLSIRLDKRGKIVEGPEQIRAQGGDSGAQSALFQAGRRALIRAQGAGEFAKLPPEKYEGWKLIYVTFTPEEIGFSS